MAEVLQVPSVVQPKSKPAMLTPANLTWPPEPPPAGGVGAEPLVVVVVVPAALDCVSSAGMDGEV